MADTERLLRFSHSTGQFLRKVSAFLGVAGLYFAGLIAAALFAGSVHSSHPRHAPETSWAELRLVESLEIVGLLTIAAVVAMAVSIAMDKVRGCHVDLRFYPVPRRIRTILRSPLPRTVLAVGFLAIVGYLITAFATPWLLGPISNGPFRAAERILLSLAWTWATIWLAETLVHPVRAAILAAIIFSVATLLVGCCPRMRPSVSMRSANADNMMVRSVSDLIFSLASEFEFGYINHIPPWATETTETKHFVYHHANGDSPVRASLHAQERHYEFFKQVFSIKLPQQIHYVKYPDRETIVGAFSPAGGGYIHSRWWFHPHEAVHNYLRSRNSFLHEGLAEAFGTTFYYIWGDFSDHTPEMGIQGLYEGMDRLFGVTEADRRISCNFIRWLYHRHGPERMVTALREAYVEGNKTRNVFTRVYDVPFADLATQWQRDQEWLSAQQPPEGFFAYPPWDREGRAPVSIPDVGDPEDQYPPGCLADGGVGA